MDYVATDTVKYPEWVADDRCDTNLGTVRNAWRRERRATDALHDVTNLRPTASATTGLALLA
jgi:hypothetical protein